MHAAAFLCQTVDKPKGPAPYRLGGVGSGKIVAGGRAWLAILLTTKLEDSVPRRLQVFTALPDGKQAVASEELRMKGHPSEAQFLFVVPMEAPRRLGPHILEIYVDGACLYEMPFETISAAGLS